MLDEMFVVRYEQHTAFETVERSNQRFDGLQIQVIGGLIHDDQMRLLPRQQRESHATALTSAQRRNLLSNQILIEAEATPVKHIGNSAASEAT